MLKWALDASSQPKGFLIVAILIVVVGVAALLGAIFDPGGRFSRFYDSNKDLRLGFLALSRNSRQFRIWFALTGAGVMAIGIAGIVIST